MIQVGCRSHPTCEAPNPSRRGPHSLTVCRGAAPEGRQDQEPRPGNQLLRVRLHSQRFRHLAAPTERREHALLGLVHD